MVGIIRYLLDEATDGDITIMNAFGRPKIYDDMVINVRTLPNAVRVDAFTKIIAYKKYMTGGNFNIAAAYVQLVTLFYKTLENKKEFKEQMLSACKLFVSNHDNIIIRDGISMTNKLGIAFIFFISLNPI